MGALLAAVLAAAPAAAADLQLATVSGSFSVPVTSIREARFVGVIGQKYDFSCGSAALATLLTFHYGVAVAEDEVFKTMFAAGDQEKIRRLGFSLLDMKVYLEGVGLRANGYKEPLDKLREVGIPAIVLIDVGGYRHFVVVTGVGDTEVTIADPSTGVKVQSRAKFEATWNGLLFVVENETERARPTFNQPAPGTNRAPAHPSGAVPREVLGLVPWTLPTRNTF